MKSNEKIKFAFLFGDIVLGLPICIVYSFYKFYFMRFYGFNTVLFNIIIPDIVIFLIFYIIGLSAAFLFIIILAGIKKGVEEAAYELKEDFISEFNIRKINEDEGNNEN